MLGLLLWPHLTLVDLEEVLRLSGMLSSNIVEGSGRDVVGFTLLHKAVVLEEILLLGRVDVRLRLEDSFCFRTGDKLLVRRGNGTRGKHTGRCSRTEVRLREPCWLRLRALCPRRAWGLSQSVLLLR